MLTLLFRSLYLMFTKMLSVGRKGNKLGNGEKHNERVLVLKEKI